MGNKNTIIRHNPMHYSEFEPGQFYKLWNPGRKHLRTIYIVCNDGETMTYDRWSKAGGFENCIFYFANGYLSFTEKDAAEYFAGNVVPFVQRCSPSDAPKQLHQYINF